MQALDLFGEMPHPPRFIIFSSYGNDSVALVQWAADQGLEDVCVVFSDTGWAARWWAKRVERMEFWVHSLGFWTSRTTSIGFVELARQKKAFPVQQYQWCSYHLKIEPAQRWLEEHDPGRRAVCLVGVRREEGPDRANFPAHAVKSENHGGRVMIAPFADIKEEDRDFYLKKAGVEPLPHRSMECSPCINSNKQDLRALTEEEIAEVEKLEARMDEELGATRNGKRRTLFRPHRCMGAVGIREVVKWAHSPRGKYKPPNEAGVLDDLGGAIADRLERFDEEQDVRAKDEFTCNNGFCAN